MNYNMELKEWVIGVVILLVLILVFSYLNEGIERAPLGDVHDPITQESPARWRVPPASVPTDGGENDAYAEESDSGEEQEE